MTDRRIRLLVSLVSVALAALCSVCPADAASCNDFVGKWAWFVGGEVTVNADGTFSQQSGNSGRWECTNPALGRITLRWRAGGFVNRMVLSPDGRNLTSTDPSQAYVTARKVSAPPPRPAPPANRGEPPRPPARDTSRAPSPPPAGRVEPARPGAQPSVRPPQLLWETKLDELGISDSPPAIAGGVVYLVDGYSALVALDARTGKEQWVVSDSDLSLLSRPVVTEGVIYICDTGGVKARTTAGRELWRFSFEEICGPELPVVAGGVLYFGGGGILIKGNTKKDAATLYALDTRTGQKKLGITEPASFGSDRAAVADGVVYVGSRDGQLHAYQLFLDSRERRRPVIWTFKTGGPINSSPAVNAGVVYVGSDDSYLYAIDVETRQQRWRFKTGAAVRSSPAIADGVVYFSSGDRRLYAVDANTGHELWRRNMRGGHAVSAGVVYVGNEDGYLYALDAKSGRERWKFRTKGQPSIFEPVVADGVVYAVNEGWIQAIR